MCVAEREPGPAHVLLRGNPARSAPEVGPGVPEVLGGGSPDFTRDRGKRRALADWLTDPRNPLTARVMANRLWQYHFGRGIVPTPNDFGKLGEPPTHPELLDWLATEFVAGGWRLKRDAPADHALERLPDVVAGDARRAGRRPGRRWSGASPCGG